MVYSLRRQDEPVIDTWVKELSLAGYHPVAVVKSAIGATVEISQASLVLYIHWHRRLPRCRVASNDKGPQFFSDLEEGIEYVNDTLRTA